MKLFCGQISAKCLSVSAKTIQFVIQKHSRLILLITIKTFKLENIRSEILYYEISEWKLQNLNWVILWVKI